MWHVTVHFSHINPPVIKHLLSIPSTLPINKIPQYLEQIAANYLYAIGIHVLPVSMKFRPQEIPRISVAAIEHGSAFAFSLAIDKVALEFHVLGLWVTAELPLVCPCRAPCRS